jgi:microcystin-dependent protein
MAVNYGTTAKFALRYLLGTSTVRDIDTGFQSLATDVEGAITAEVFPGLIVMTGRTTAPTARWLLCDGAVVVRATYAALFTAIGTTYNTGGEAGTDFRLPDLRGRVPMGVDGTAGRIAASDALGNSGGTETTTLTAAQSGTTAHTHAISDSGHDHYRGGNILNVTTGGSGPTAIDRDPDPAAAAGANTTSSETTGISVTAHAGASASSSHTNVQPYQVVNYLIHT